MFKRAVFLYLITIVSLLLPSTSLLFSQIHITGSLFGTLEDTTYIVDGDIRIDGWRSLVIEPGAILLFAGYYQFDIDGYLYAVGTESDSIVFMPDTGVDFWAGIDFNDDADDSSRMGYCLITGGYAEEGYYEICGGGLLIQNCNPLIHNCTITGNSANLHGGGVYGIGCDSEFIECVISNNTCVDDGVGLAFYGSTPYIKDCIIVGNTCTGNSGEGGGFACGASSAIIEGCEIRENTSRYGGGVMFGQSYDCSIINCTISNNLAELGGGVHSGEESAEIVIDSCNIYDNIAEESGGGIFFYSAHTYITRCSIYRNQSFEGGAIYVYGTSSLIDNCTIVDNLAEERGGAIFAYSLHRSIIRNSIFADNQGTGCIGKSFHNQTRGILEFNDFSNNGVNFFNLNLPGLERIEFVNTNGDSCDRFGNIYLDPMFVDPANCDYNLQENSPCIDAGDPASPFDPDSTIADMGVHYFDQNAWNYICEEYNNGSSGLGVLSDFTLYPPYPNPFNTQTVISYQLQADSYIKLAVYDVMGREIASLVTGHSLLGYHEVVWDASDQSSGVYFVRLKAGNYNQTQKLILLK